MSAGSSASPNAGPPSPAASLAVVVVCLILGATSALEARHVSVTHGFPLDWGTVVMSTTPRWVLLAAVLPIVLWLGVRFPVTPPRARTVTMHVSLFLLVSLAHAIADAWAVTFAAPEVTRFFGVIPRLTRSWYNLMPTMVSMYGGVLIAAWGITEARERQRRTLRASQLEGQLQSARLAALRAQLQPHFLYNTLNGIAALVSDVQPARAVAAIEQLGELLHASLREDGREEITVAEEVALAERYLALQEMRFGDRLKYEWSVAPEVAECLVPVLLLQPIVENAVVHGLDAGQESLNVRVDVVPTELGVELTVQNDGNTLAPNGTKPSGHGVGIASTRARLLTAYGDRASLTLLPRDGGGVLVRIVVPRRVAPAGQASSTVPIAEPVA
jgi:two-component system, LytTR family, sensor kinase